MLVFASSILLALTLHGLLTELGRSHPSQPVPNSTSHAVVTVADASQHAGPLPPDPSTQTQPNTTPGPPTPLITLADLRGLPVISVMAGVIGAALLIIFAASLARRTDFTRKLILFTCMLPYYSGCIGLCALLLIQHTRSGIP